MKKMLIYGLLVAAALLAPVRANDVGDLQPVRVVQVSKEAGNILLQTDTGDWGMGENITAALENLKATTPGILYLDTARYLLISEDVQNEISDLRKVMKGNVHLCLAEGAVLGEEIVPFLRSHGQLPQLKNWKAGASLPLLTMREKRWIFSKKSENNA